MRVLCLARYGRLGASSRLRCYQYLPYLERRGVQVRIAPFLGDDYVSSLYLHGTRRALHVALAYLRRFRDLLSIGGFDLLWIQAELLPWLPAWGERLLARLRIPYVVDYDDAIFHRYDLHPHRLVRALLGRKIDAVMRNATLVIAGNSYLAARALRAGAPHVEEIPTAVDPDRYPPRQCAGKGTFTIGWVGTPITERYLRVAASALAEVARGGTARLVLVGAKGLGFHGIPSESRDWSETTEAQEIRSFDVGIMPLEDSPWERGKCGYKLIQYMASGVPVVASPVGANTVIVNHGVDGFLATTTAEWVEALTRLREDPNLRWRMGKAGRSKVEERYSTRVTGPRLVTLLLHAGGTDRAGARG